MRLLERDPFADQLRTWLADAAVCRGRLVLLGGEAGVGKTALVHHFAEQASKQARGP
jgi:predicted ATPase